MKKTITLIIFILIGSCLLSTSVFAQTDYEKIIENVNTEIKKGYSASTTALNAGITTSMANMNPDGSWNDLNYVNGVAGDVPFNNHLTRLRTMAVAYTFPGASYFGSAALYAKIVSGLQYWNGNIHDAFNWYNDQISYPQLLGEFLILMRKGSTVLPATDENNAILYLSSRDNPSTKTGANRVDEAVHWIYNGALTANAARVNVGVTQTQSTLTLVNSGDEGINPDLAFLQHESQLMIQGYGRDFLDGIYNVAIYIVGTSFGFTSAQLENAYLFLHNTYVGAARGAYKDFNLDGRGISRKNSNKGISSNIIANAITVDPVHATALQADYLRVTQAQPPSYMVTQPYHVHFWTGDYTMHNRPAYTFAVRSNSVRTVRTETMNGENLLGTWLSDGATSIRVDGDEYNNIFPVWDWNKVPGITMREYATPVQNPNRYVASSYGKTTFVGGVSDSSYGTSTYKMNNGGVTGTKSWFFFDNEIVCLGAGITSTATETVATTLNQALLSGTVTVKSGGSVATLPVNTVSNFATKPDWILHNKVGYFFPATANVSVSNQTQTGDWATIGTATGAVSADVFKLWINQGAKPTDATYQYIVAPGITTASQMDAYNSAALQVLSNTASLQAVMHTGLNIVEIIFSSAGTLTIPGTELKTVTVDKACALLIKNINTGNPVIHISDPAQQTTTVNVNLTFATAAAKNLLAVLPTGNYKGSSKLITDGAVAPPFVPGVLAVLRVGGVNGTNGTGGSSGIFSSGSPVHIDKFSVTAAGVISYLNSIDLPVTGTNKIYNSASNAEGYLTQSANKQWLSMMGYASTGSGTIYNTILNPGISRTLGLVKYDNSIDLTTALSNFPVSGTGATVQTSITNNGTDLWSSTSQGTSNMGVLFTKPGATDATNSPSLIVTSSNAVVNSIKSLGIFGGDLYYAAGGGTSRIGTVTPNGGLPLNSGNDMTPLNSTGTTTFNSFVPSQTVMFDMNPSILGYDVMYVTNSANTASLSGVYKYCKNEAGDWVSFGSFGSVSSDGIYFGITGEVLNELPVLYVTRGVTTNTTVATNQLIQLTETNGYNANMSATITATANAITSGKGGTLRGVAFFPAMSYYFIGGTQDLNDIANWGTNLDGSGTHPANFTDDQQIFFITNGASATLSTDFVVSGVNSKVILGDGQVATSLTIPANFKISAEMDVYNKATLNILNTQIPALHYVAANSLINYAATTDQTVKPIAYGNFSINNNEAAIINGIVSIAGNIVQNGTLKGTGTLVVNNGLTNSGTLSPGNGPGLFNVTGDFVNAPTGILEIELGGNTTAGTDFDQLAVSGNAALGGTLNILLVDNFVPQTGQTFTILTAAAVSGTFATVNFPAGFTGTVTYNATTVVITINAVVLPLRLLSFTGSVLQTGKNQLLWKTADENNTDFFGLERSANGSNYDPLLKKTAIGRGSNSYEALDENPLKGLNYYRLKMVDKDARFTYSNTIILKNNNAGKFNFYPNPVKNALLIDHAAGDQNSFVQVAQADGKLMIKQQIVPTAVQTSVDFTKLLPGVYFVSITSGKETNTFKVVKE